MSAQTIAACTGCGDCVESCTQDVLRLGDGVVRLAAENGTCTFCGDCAEACPEPVFDELREMAHIAQITNDCFVEAGIACMTCRDVCPEIAITVRPQLGGIFMPILNAADCTGCGACVAPCPANAITLISKEQTDV
ncbi:ferredoxin-type protein NapF [Falsihalocynthiibacter sp. SS001]|uniref:ferredoxin-type protein NapF n=1 Tax=Falsihalocynthiibacter sp. SS001 TaxID=3349698 RepID=UPI0036D27868